MYKNTSEVFCVHVGDVGWSLWCESACSVISPVLVKPAIRLKLHAIANRIYLFRDELFVFG
jgi:hypothetical protein